MFQSFTGNSRRPRQVNLSGRNSNPFAAATGTTSQPLQNAIAHAQQERVLRYQERERLQAAKTLQKVWRGSRSRQDTKLQYKREWDVKEASGGSGPTKDTGISATQLQYAIPYTSEEETLAQLRLLAQFASSHKEDDVLRLQLFSRRFGSSCLSWSNFKAGHDWIYPLLRLARVSALMLIHGVRTKLSPDHATQDLLKFISQLAMIIPEQMALHSKLYYHAIAKTIRRSTHESFPPDLDTSLFESAIMALLEPPTAYVMYAYEGFVSEVLTISEFREHLSNFDALAQNLNFTQLNASLKGLLSSDPRSTLLAEKSNGERLWLLAYFVYFYHSEHESKSLSKEAPDADFVLIVSKLLSHLADEISSRTDISGNASSPPLPSFVNDQILSLVNQNSVTSLLAQSEAVSGSATRDHDKTAAIARYALTLLRVFPRKGDEIRMWLYLGSTSKGAGIDNHTGRPIPAIKYFWGAVSETGIFASILEHPRNAVEFLSDGSRESAHVRSRSNKQKIRDKEWTVVLLFLELYSFVLKVMDDEEFMSGKSSYDETQSWTRQSALDLEQIKYLTQFLRNLAFSMYWYASDIVGAEESTGITTSLADYFSNTATTSKTAPFSQPSIRVEDITIANLSGMTISYTKGMVTGLLRMVYERDSRRKFLPRDHWLMTQYFDMEGFIPAVVAEEDYRHQMQETDEFEGNGAETEIDDGMDDRETLVGTHRTQQVLRIERLKRQQRKVARRKHLEKVAPRLGILQNMPFFIPFAIRVEIFREFVTVDQMRRRNGFIDADQWRLSVMQNFSALRSDRRATYDSLLGKHHAKVRRESVFNDAFDQFYELGEGLKEPIQITFVDKFDTAEAGIDGGGVTKEFLTSVTSEAFAPTNGLNLFIENDEHLLYPNPAAVDERKDLLRQVGFKEGSPDWNEPIRDLLRRYEFLGRVIGKCLYEGILVDIHFAPFFLLKWALTGGSGSATNESNYRANINDLRDLDEGLYQGLLKLKNYPGNVEDFSLDFTVTDTISTPAYDAGLASQASQRTITRDLRQNGSQISVTNENRLVYISYMARHRLQIQPRLQTNAFLKGLAAMIQPSWLSMFNQSELQTLLGGDSSEIDVSDLRQNTLYGGVYVIGDDGHEHPSVSMFWEVMRSLSDSDRRKVLKYVTSTPRAPLLGFGQLNPHFSIRDSGSDQTRLPSASTCVNLLKLPIYSDAKTLRDKLLYAINAGAGFNLS